ncbi:hypothetical protein AGMMS50225_13340 [Betaproteobacteria bacterium]|nr:hypothetical protein AGMMS50225_13340 [Betaproteobacteria bacterium]
MAGMLFILFLLASFCLLVFVSWAAARLARRYGRRGGWYGMAVFLAVMGLLFWDWLPMEISYKNKCENEAGLTQYKTPEEWQAENPGVWETLTPMPSEYRNPVRVGENSLTRWQLNERFAQEYHVIKHWFSIIEESVYIIDMKTNTLIASYTDFRSDVPPISFVNQIKLRSLRFWMNKRNCIAIDEPLGWQKPRELRERLALERGYFFTLATTFKGNNK